MVEKHHKWFLIMSDKYTLKNPKELAGVLDEIETGNNPTQAILICAKRKDGSLFPRNEDLSRGLIDRHISLCVRMQQFLKFIKHARDDSTISNEEKMPAAVRKFISSGIDVKMWEMGIAVEEDFVDVEVSKD